jgi:hypothetical protein
LRLCTGDPGEHGHGQAGGRGTKELSTVEFHLEPVTRPR